MTVKSVLYKYDPVVPKYWLLLLAGFVWMAVGIFLCLRALGWLEPLPHSTAILFAASGAAVAVLWNRLMFAGIAQRSVHRISQLPERTCVFAFSAWRGYAMIGLMIILGATLRSVSMPKHYLAASYIVMGGTLVLSSFVFYRSYWNRKQDLKVIAQEK